MGQSPRFPLGNLGSIAQNKAMTSPSETTARVSQRRPSAAARSEAPADLDTSGKPAPAKNLVPIATVVLILVAGLGWFAYLSDGFTSDTGPPTNPTSVPIPSQYNGDRAMSYLIQLCEIGPRPSASEGMKRQQRYLTEFFTARGAKVELQHFSTRHPEDGSAVPMANLIASWYPGRIKRFLLCAHYDTRPFPDRDRQNRKGVFVGANDGASGTAALMELSHSLAALPDDVGVDIVLFDGEEFVFQDPRDEYFHGSTYYAQQYAAQPPVNAFQAGILLDMVGDRELKIYFEQNSIRYARDVARSVWSTAERLGVTAFVPRVRHELRDDHLPLIQIARIPTIDIIDFDYPRPGLGAPSYWHTEQDVPENCSGQSLAAVVWVVHTWLIEQSNLNR